MPLAQDGDLAQLMAVSELSANQLGPALHQLAQLSLLNIRGTLEDRRYHIHRLTETFLLNEALQWKQTH